MSTHALIATAHFHGEVVQHRYTAEEPVEIGPHPPLALPLPAGVPWIARVEWVNETTARITDAHGRQYALDVDEALEMEFGDLRLDLELTPQFTLRRTETFPWKLSTGWLLTVLLFTIFTSWYDMVKERVCPIFGVTEGMAVALGCIEGQNQGGDGSDWTAEYLARLLKKDYAGEDEGYIERLERPEDGRQEKRSIYLPAGNEGPVTKLGGAEEVAPDAVRAPRTEELPEPERQEAGKPSELVLEAPEEVGTPIEPQETDGIAEGEGLDEEDQDEAIEEVEQPAEEEEGWGLQDWYDEKDRQIDDLEIKYTIEIAKRRLRIDPNDPTALSLLSYYQYLAEDYKAAEGTYDKYIELLPDEAAGYNNKALIYKRLGQYQKEESLYRVALSLEPFDVTAMNNLGVNLAHQHRFDEALAVMKQLETMDPDDPYANLHRAKIYAEMGNDEQAYAYLEKSLEGMAELDTLHHIEFRQDIRLDPSFAKLRETRRFRAILLKYYGDDTPVPE
ncbi:MAG: tetratricopeptide repeat protein [Alphaproteobacteria bacterium]|nr:tetratricopeptide repeat protein [Alphaproteobacteria bacterium]